MGEIHFAAAKDTRDRHFSLLKIGQLSPVAAALAYPYILKCFHGFAAQAETEANLLAAGALLMALCVPLYGLCIAILLGGIARPSAFAVRARRLAFVSLASPPLFVLFGVGLGLLGNPIADLTAWNIFWIALALFGAAASDNMGVATDEAAPKLRVFHGVTAALLVVFIGFHLGNHTLALLGPDTHALVMEAGRTVYRSGAIEPLLLGLLLTQLLSGGRLAWIWSKSGGDFFRTVQIASGIYVGAFVVTHLNSALVSARLIRDVPTDWAWAAGAPEGLLMDAWNIRLLPHYAFAVLFMLIHLSSGLRAVMIAHGVASRLANRIWGASVVLSGVVAAIIIGALCGLRI